jgi:putative phage-type endonuclease
MSYIKKTFKTKDDWLKAREKTIGGSECSAVVGASKWLTRDDLYNKIVLNKKKKVAENQRILDGIKSENLIAEQFAIDDKRFHIKKQSKNSHTIFQREDKPYLSVSPDRLATFIPTGQKVGIEIKDIELTKKEERENWEKGQIPNQYFYQALQYFVVLDVEIVIVLAHLNYMVYNEDTQTMEHSHSVTQPYYLYREELEKEIAWLEKKETEYWENYILKRKRPPLVIEI